MNNDDFIWMFVMKIVNFVQNFSKFGRFWKDPFVSFSASMKIQTKFLMLNSLRFKIIRIIIPVSIGKIDDKTNFFSRNGLKLTHAKTSQDQVFAFTFSKPKPICVLKFYDVINLPILAGSFISIVPMKWNLHW